MDYGTIENPRSFEELYYNHLKMEGRLHELYEPTAGEICLKLFLACFVIIFSSYIGGLIGATRGRRGTGQLLGLFLGPLGWIIALFLPREGRRCPHCCEVVADAATVCPHCQREIALPRPAPPHKPSTQPKAQAPKITKVLVSCPNCGARYNVPSVKLGYNFRCLKCGTTFTSMPEA